MALLLTQRGIDPTHSFEDVENGGILKEDPLAFRRPISAHLPRAWGQYYTYPIH